MKEFFFCRTSSADNENENFNAEDYKKLFANPKGSGGGECGLDYFRLDENNPASQKSKVESKKERQRKIFETQIGLALNWISRLCFIAATLMPTF